MKSISTSGHKFGLAPLGCGFILWRDKKDLPERLVFRVNYLGGEMAVFQLNFSRPAGQVIAQYYQFLRLGFAGYQMIHMSCYETAQYLAREIEKMGVFQVIFDGDPQQGIPAITWRLKPEAGVSFNLYDFADRLRGPRLAGARLLPAPKRPGHRGAAHPGPPGLWAKPGPAAGGRFPPALTYFQTHRICDNLTQKEAGAFNHNGT